MIRMVCGAYGGKDGLKRAGSGPFCLSEEEEARLVRRGVAAYVSVDNLLDMCGRTQPDSLPGAGDIIKAAHNLFTNDADNNQLTEESLMKLTRENLEKLATDMGADISGCRTKADIAKVLAATEVGADEDEEDALPELAPVEPVL